MFPNLPTDNLYKFLAPSGTVIVILCLYFVQTKIWEVSDRMIDAQQARQLAANRIQELKKSMDVLDKKAADLMNQRPKNDAIFKFRYTEIETLHRKIQDSLAELNIEGVNIETNQKRLDQLLERSTTILNWGVIVLICGLILASTGFCLWYVKVQKPLDLLLQKQLRSTESKNQSSMEEII